MKDSCTSAQSAPEQAGNMNSHAWLDEQDFYEVMQAYRHTPANYPQDVVAAFECVKDFIRAMLAARQMNSTPPEISTDAVEAAGRCTACGEELI